MRKIILGVLMLVCLTAHSQNLPNSYTDGKYITVNGAKLYVVIAGKGDPIIIIPGGPGGAHPGYRVFDSLAKDNQVIYFDAFGRGKSDTAKDVKEYTLARDIEDIEGLRIALHFDKLNVLGHSYGGLVAQGYALKYPSHVNHLILANTFHSYIMWQKNDDNSNHEIQTNYPEVWDSLMIIREAGAVSSDADSPGTLQKSALWLFICLQSRQFFTPVIKALSECFQLKIILSNGWKRWRFHCRK